MSGDGGAGGPNEAAVEIPTGTAWARNPDTGEWVLVPLPTVAAPKTVTEIETERQNALIAQINDKFKESGRDAMYGTARDDVFGVQKTRINERRDTAQRGLGFSLASRGLTGGSADIDANAQEGRAYTSSLLDAFGSASTQADSLRANDEKTRLNLIQNVRSGEESLASTNDALESARISAQNASSRAGWDAADRYAAQAGSIYQNYQANQGVNQARQSYGGSSIYGVPRSASGTISR